jgi:hypothetical protein
MDDPAESLDIDTIWDWQIAEMVVEKMPGHAEIADGGD